MVDLSGIEPEFIQCHCIVLPLNYKPRFYRPSPLIGVKSVTLTLFILCFMAWRTVT